MAYAYRANQAGNGAGNMPYAANGANTGGSNAVKVGIISTDPDREPTNAEVITALHDQIVLYSMKSCHTLTYPPRYAAHLGLTGVDMLAPNHPSHVQAHKALFAQNKFYANYVVTVDDIPRNDALLAVCPNDVSGFFQPCHVRGCVISIPKLETFTVHLGHEHRGVLAQLNIAKFINDMMSLAEPVYVKHLTLNFKHLTFANNAQMLDFITAVQTLVVKERLTIIGYDYQLSDWQRAVVALLKMRAQPMSYEMEMREADGQPKPYHAEYVIAKCAEDFNVPRDLDDPLSLYEQHIAGHANNPFVNPLVAREIADADTRYEVQSNVGLLTRN